MAESRQTDEAEGTRAGEAEERADDGKGQAALVEATAPSAEGQVEERPAAAVSTVLEVPSSPKPGPKAPTKLRPAEGVSGKANARMTLFGTALVFAVTFIAWGGAKVSCNLHPPRYEAFKPAPLTRLAATPKNGALEFHHRLATRNFDGANELAAEDGKRIVAEARGACDEGCRNGAKERAEQVLTRAVVLSRQGSTAVVRVESFFDGEVDTRTYRVIWQDRLWKVLGVEP